jgi:UDP-N-acetylmuramate--alanine ligase
VKDNSRIGLVKMQQVHFIGAGGVGMNGLAQLAIACGYSVSGSDRAYASESEPFKSLEQIGVTFFPQDGSAIRSNSTQVVYSTAIESDNPDLQKARALNCPMLHRAAFLKQLTGGDKVIAIAGTAGKTTTTGLLGWIFEYAGKDPSVYNGASLINWKKFPNLGNTRKGNSDLWIIEADESDKSCLRFNPAHTIITNISRDHYELDELNRIFDQFESQTAGITVRGPSLAPTDLAVSMLGKHNLENARCAFALSVQLGLAPELVREAISRFQGIERRLEIVGCSNGITVIDDYAHNPAKISASLAAVAEKFSRLHAFWRPHGFTPLFQGLDDFVELFSNHWKSHAGSILILPVYYAGGTVERRVTSDTLVERLKSDGIEAELVKDYAELKRKLEERAASGDAILGMGARDPELPQFAKRLVSEWKKS